MWGAWGMFGISVINKIFNSKMITKKYSLITFLFIFIYLASCGQQVMKDEGLDTKSIEDIGSSTEFKVVSVDPADGATNVAQNKQVSFTFSKPLLTYGASGSTTCGDNIFEFSYQSNFSGTSCRSIGNNCFGGSSFYQTSNNYKTITLCTDNSFASGTKIYVRVSSSGNNAVGNLTTDDGTSFTEFSSSFTTN